MKCGLGTEPVILIAGALQLALMIGLIARVVDGVL